MKKWFIGLLIMLCIAITTLYFFIPNQIEISHTAYINVPAATTSRFVSDESKWILWWPGKNFTQAREDTNKVSFVFNNAEYSIIYKAISAIEVIVNVDAIKSRSNILILPLERYSTALHWKGIVHTGKDPFRKIQNYQQAKRLKQNINTIFNALKFFLEKQDNVYGLSITETRVIDTLLVTSKMKTSDYPTMKQVYSLINSLRKYISGQDGKETNYPMLHVSRTDSTVVTSMVAIPVNKRIANNMQFTFKRMVPGKILVAEVKGGINTIESGLMQMENFINDYQMKSPAIPFQSLVTDRLKNLDSTKWITRIYYPIL